MRILAFIVMLLMFSKNLVANEQIVLGLSQDEVAITANFDGSKILYLERYNETLLNQMAKWV
mgnify:CR=1 FL=1